MPCACTRPGELAARLAAGQVAPRRALLTVLLVVGGTCPIRGVSARVARAGAAPARVARARVAPARAAPDTSGSAGVVLPEVTAGAGARPAAQPARAASAVGQRLPPARSRTLRRRGEAVYRLRPLPRGGYRVEAPGWRARIAPDGSVEFFPRRARYDAPGAAVRFDLTETIGRGRVSYVAQKLAFLADTAPLRARLRRRAQLRWRHRFFRDLPARLQRVLSRRDLSPRRKRALLFQLWQECLEPGDSPLRAQAQRARQQMLALLRARIAGPGRDPRPGQIGPYGSAECQAIVRQRAGRIPFPLCPPPRRRGEDAAPGRRPRSVKAPGRRTAPRPRTR